MVRTLVCDIVTLELYKNLFFFFVLLTTISDQHLLTTQCGLWGEMGGVRYDLFIYLK